MQKSFWFHQKGGEQVLDLGAGCFALGRLAPAGFVDPKLGPRVAVLLTISSHWVLEIENLFMADDKKKGFSLLSEVVVGVVVTVLVGSAVPWWWGKLFPENGSNLKSGFRSFPVERARTGRRARRANE